MGLPNLHASGVTISSVLIPEPFLTRQTIEDLQFAALEHLAAEVAKQVKGAPALTFRDLMPADLGFPNESWTEQTGTTEAAWETTQVSSDVLADDTWVVIWGVQEQSERPVYQGIRWEVGGARIQQWSLTQLWMVPSRTGFVLSPIVISKNKVMTVYGYVLPGAGPLGSVTIQYLGATAELEGRALRP